MARPAPASTLFPYTTLFRSQAPPIVSRSGKTGTRRRIRAVFAQPDQLSPDAAPGAGGAGAARRQGRLDRKSTRLNSSHVSISYAVFCLKKKKKPQWTADVHF